MKKIVLFILMLYYTLYLAGCSSEKSFNITGISKIELLSGNTGATVEITDEEEIAYITNNINAMMFSKEKSSKDTTGWSYWLKWYDSDNNLKEEIIVMSEYRIEYKDYFYTCKNADLEIDIAFLDKLLDMEK